MRVERERERERERDREGEREREREREKQRKKGADRYRHDGYGGAPGWCYTWHLDFPNILIAASESSITVKHLFVQKLSNIKNLNICDC